MSLCVSISPERSSHSMILKIQFTYLQRQINTEGVHWYLEDLHPDLGMTFLFISLELVNVKCWDLQHRDCFQSADFSWMGTIPSPPCPRQTSSLLRHYLPQKEGIPSTQRPLCLKCFMLAYHCPAALTFDSKLHLMKNLAHNLVYLDPTWDSAKLHSSPRIIVWVGLTCVSWWVEPSPGDQEQYPSHVWPSGKQMC